MNVLLARQKRIVNKHILSLKQINSWVPEILLGLLNRETASKQWQPSLVHPLSFTLPRLLHLNTHYKGVHQAPLFEEKQIHKQVRVKLACSNTTIPCLCLFSIKPVSLQWSRCIYEPWISFLFLLINSLPFYHQTEWDNSYLTTPVFHSLKMYAQNSHYGEESLGNWCSSALDNHMHIASLYTRICYTFITRAVSNPLFSVSSHHPIYNVGRVWVLPRTFCWGFYSTQSLDAKQCSKTVYHRKVRGSFLL